MTTRNGRLRPLSLPFFTMFWAAQAISLFGDRLNNFSLVALINKFADNPGLTLSKIYLAMYLPIFTLAPLIGVLVDRLNKRWVLVSTDVLRGALVALVPLLFTRTGSFLPVMAIVFLLTTGNLFFLPAKSSLVPELVPDNKLVRINSILWSAGIAGMIGGFLGGGLIFDYLSWSACFYLDGATYFLSAILLTGIALQKGTARISAPVAGKKEKSIFSAIREGLGLAKSSSRIMSPLGIQSLVFFGAGGFSVLAIVLIRDISPPGSSLGLSIAGLSIGLGMGIGSILVNRIYVFHREYGKSILFVLLVPAAVVIASGHGLAAIATGFLIAGVSASPLVIISESELQERTAADMRGRIFSLREIVTRGLFLASAFMFSSLGKFIHRGVLLILLGLFLASTGIIWIRIIKGSEQS